MGNKALLIIAATGLVSLVISLFTIVKNKAEMSQAAWIVTVILVLIGLLAGFFLGYTTK